jgi:hypothetical protein
MTPTWLPRDRKVVCIQANNRSQLPELNWDYAMKHSFLHWSRRTARNLHSARVMTEMSAPAKTAVAAPNRCWIAVATSIQSSPAFQSLLFSRWTAAGSGTPLWQSIADRN